MEWMRLGSEQTLRLDVSLLPLITLDTATCYPQTKVNNASSARSAPRFKCQTGQISRHNRLPLCHGSDHENPRHCGVRYGLT